MALLLLTNIIIEESITLGGYLMYGYRDYSARTPYKAFYCPYSMYLTECPFCYGYRPKAEEYQLQQQEPPKNPPPSYTPKLSDLPEPNLTKVESGAISPCIYKYTYLWLKNGESYWSYIVRIGNISLSGWRYIGGRWISFSLDLKDLKNFVCS